MNHKVGDRVRVRSQEWIDSQAKDSNGNIEHGFVSSMFAYAGRAAKIVAQAGVNFWLDIDYGVWAWHDEMFDPDYDPYGPLSAKDAILAMVEGGETLCDEDGSKHWFNRVRACFDTNSDRELAPDDSNYFHGLRRRPPKSSRDWTRWELLAWVISDESRGWVVNLEDDTEWHSPHFYSYKSDISLFRRARMLPDGAGIDRTTIQGFEKEE